jgi:hypothetical protein
MSRLKSGLIRAQSRKIRQSLGIQNLIGIAIYIIPATMRPPELVGHSWRYETKTGIPIQHPSAYRQRGWSSMCYVGSTRSIRVGADWLTHPYSNERGEYDT